jgi:hypothetical protein
MSIIILKMRQSRNISQLAEKLNGNPRLVKMP